MKKENVHLDRIPGIRTGILFTFLVAFLSGNIWAQDYKTGPKIEATDPMEVQPMGPNPDWAPNIDPQMLAVIEQLQAFENPKGTEMTAFQFRNAKTPAEAAMAILMKSGVEPSSPKVDISHKILPVGPEDGVLVRIYKPVLENKTNEQLPVIVYYHGGGWVIADLDTYEPSPMAIAAKAKAIVVSVAYRQAPEHTFPTAHEDSFAAYKWVVENAAQIGGDPNNIATAGESAGGNLAVAVPLMAKDRNVKLPVHILSVYPIADGDLKSESYDQYAKAIPLSKGLMGWFFDRYYPEWKTSKDPFINLTSADLSGLPATTIINAEIDPLEAEGGELAEKMRAAGIDVTREVYSGVTHEFFGMAAILEQAVQAQELAVKRLKSSFKK